MSFTLLSLVILINFVFLSVYLLSKSQTEVFPVYRHVPEEETIDIVYTWVNGSDPEHRLDLENAIRRFGLFEESEEELPELLAELNSSTNGTRSNESENSDDALGEHRFFDNDEMRYSLRSVERYAPWVRRIYIVTNGQLPSWLNIDNPRIFPISHAMIFPNQSHLPTFSSPAIEAHLHRIPGLSEQFVYLNDDVLFGAPVHPTDFWTEGNGHRAYLSWPIPYCNKGCPPSWIGDGYCDVACNNSKCNWDGGDCYNVTRSQHGYWWWNTRNRTETGVDNWRFPPPSSYCAPGCPDSWIGDRFCDKSCKYKSCGFDAGDCGTVIMKEGGMQMFNLTWATTTIHVNSSESSVFFNLTEVFPSSATIVDGTHDNDDIVRSATISKRQHILTLVFFKVYCRCVGISVTADVGSSRISKSFNITYGSDKCVNSSVICSGIVNLPAPLFQNMSNTSNGNGIQANESTSREQSIVAASVKENENQGSPRNISEDAEEIIVGVSEARKRFYQSRLLSIKEIDGHSNPQMNRELFAARRWVTNTLEKEKSGVGRDYAESDSNMVEQEFQASMWTRQDRKLLGLGQGMESAQRRLLDKFADSLTRVNSLMDQAYGVKSRKVPAHMPHFITRSIMKECQAKWPDEWDMTSAGVFRSGNDMQYMFTYTYFLMNTYIEHDCLEILQDLDKDGDGFFSYMERRSLVKRLFGKSKRSVNDTDLRFLYNTNHATDLEWEEFLQENEVSEYDILVPLEDILANETLCAALKQVGGKSAKYKYEKIGLDHIHFTMLRSKRDGLDAFDDLLAVPKKFICINDNVNHSSQEAIEISEILQRSYEALLPFPSQYELAKGKSHGYHSVEDYYGRHHGFQKIRRKIQWGSISILFIAFTYYTYTRIEGKLRVIITLPLRLLRKRRRNRSQLRQLLEL